MCVNVNLCYIFVLTYADLIFAEGLVVSFAFTVHNTRSAFTSTSIADV